MRSVADLPKHGFRSAAYLADLVDSASGSKAGLIEHDSKRLEKQREVCWNTRWRCFRNLLLQVEFWPCATSCNPPFGRRHAHIPRSTPACCACQWTLTVLKGRCDCGCGYAAELLELARLPELEANPEYILHAPWMWCKATQSTCP